MSDQADLKHAGSTTTRRNVLSSSRILAALGLSAGCVPTPSPVVAPPTEPTTPLAAIDVHCHVFNARDLPITGFIQHIYVPEAIEHAPVLGPASNALTLLLGHMLRLPALTPSAELARLRGSRGARTFSTQPDRGSPSDTRTDDQVLRDALQFALPRYLDDRPGSAVRRELFSLGVTRPELRSASEPTEEERQLLLDILTGRPSLRTFDNSPTRRRFSIRQLVEDIMRGPEEVVGVLRLGGFLGLSRSELVKRLVQLPDDGSGREVRLFTPAVIDFTMWLTEGPLDQLNVSSLPDQVDVMGEIAATPGQAYGIHPFVPFCPWRQVRDEANASSRSRGMTPLDVVKYAVQEQGFVGVKLYPVLGFYPSGNAARWKNEPFPASLRGLDADGTKLDRALAELYDWCLAEDVAIMAHTSESQNPTPEAGRRGSPAFWKEMLDHDNGRWQSIRLNLGHLGGVWHLGKSGPPTSWPSHAVGLLSRGYPNVYADLADYDAIAHRTQRDTDQDAQIMPIVRDLLARQTNAGAVDRLMYGTDWVMLSRSLAAKDFYRAMRDKLPEQLNMTSMQRRGFLGGHAARFLGIAVADGQKPKTRLRLEEFYRKRDLDPSRLALWDSPPPTA